MSTVPTVSHSQVELFCENGTVFEKWNNFGTVKQFLKSETFFEKMKQSLKTGATFLENLLKKWNIF